MNLYEITTGRTGKSYERCYVWSASKRRAVLLFIDKYPESDIASVRKIMSSDDFEFVTKLDDSGFLRE